MKSPKALRVGTGGRRAALRQRVRVAPLAMLALLAVLIDCAGDAPQSIETGTGGGQARVELADVPAPSLPQAPRPAAVAMAPVEVPVVRVGRPPLLGPDAVNGDRPPRPVPGIEVRP